MFAECRGALGSAESAAGSSYLVNVTKGADDRSCLYTLDYPPFLSSPGTVGGWEYGIDGDGPFVTYTDRDAGHPLDGYTYRFTDDDCRARQIDSDGDWTDIEIADL